MKTNTNNLTKQALKVLSLAGFHVWRQNNGGVFDPTKKVFRRNSSTPGTSDIIGYNRKTGQFIACEIKVGKDKLSAAQELFLADVRNAGAIGIVIKNIDELIEITKLCN